MVIYCLRPIISISPAAQAVRNASMYSVRNGWRSRAVLIRDVHAPAARLADTGAARRIGHGRGSGRRPQRDALLLWGAGFRESLFILSIVRCTRLRLSAA